MSEETATNPVEGGDTSVEDTEAQQQEVEQTDDQELDEFGDPIAREAEDEEIELDDLKLKVPKDQAQKVREALLRQADYTRKTQELADARKAFDAERGGFQQTSQAEIDALARVSAIDQRLAEFQNVDWDRWHDEDPFEASKAEGQYNRLVQTRQQAAGQYAHLAQSRVSAAQQETAKRAEEGRVQLERDIKDWNTVGPQVMQTGVDKYGFTAQELNSFGDPRMAKVLHDAHQYHLLNKKQKQAQRHVDAQTTKPAAKPSGGASPPQGLDDRLSAEEWTRRREQQVRKRRA